MGLIQTIRLMLDKSALAQIQKEAAQASMLVANELTKELGSGKSAEQAVLKYVLRLRKAFEGQTAKLRQDLSKGLLSQQDAETSAKQFADKYTGMLARALKSGIGKNLSSSVKKQIIEASIPTAADLNMVGSSAISRYMAALRAKLVMPNLSLVDIPGAEGVGSKTERSLLSKAKGDKAVYQQMVRELQRENQALGTSLTPLGRLFQSLGFNARSLSKDYRALGQSTEKVRITWQEHLAAGRPMSALFSAMTSSVGSLVTQLGGAFAAYRAFQGLISSTQEAASAQAMWSRLAISLADFGISAEQAWPDVEQLTDRFTKMGYKSVFTAEVLATLVQFTGDYKKSLQAVPAVLDLMIDRHMTWETAARAVGRQLIGDSWTLQRHGIFLDKYKDSLTQIIARFGGAAQAKSNTLAGALDRVSVGWWQFKVNMGNAVGDAFKAENTFAHLSTAIELVSKTLSSDTVLFRTLAVAINGLAWSVSIVVLALEGAVTIVGGVLTAFDLLWVGIKTGLQALPDNFKVVFWKVYENVATVAGKIGGVIDKLMLGKTHLGQLGEDAATNAAMRGGNAAVDRNRNARTREQQRQAALDSWWKGLGYDNEGGSRNPMASIPVTNAGKVAAREEMNIRNTININRKSVMSDDAERAAEAMKRLDKIYETQQKRLAEMADDDGRRVEVQDHLSNIERIRELAAEKADQRERKARGDRAVDERISLLRKIAMLDKDEESINALKELAAIQRKNDIELNHTKANSERYFKLVDRGLEITKIAEEVHKKQFMRTDEEVKRLGEMVELGVNREEALTRLSVIQDELTAKQKDQTLSIDDQLVIAKQLLDVKAAIAVTDQKTADELERLKQMMENPETRTKAESQMQSIRLRLEHELAQNQKLTDDQRVARLKMIADIDAALEGKLSIRSVNAGVGALSQMMKNQENRPEALKLALELQDKINTAKEKFKYAPEDIAVLNAALEKLRVNIKVLSEPQLDMWKSLKDTWSTDLPDIAKSAAEQIGAAWQKTFTEMFSSTEALSHGIGNLMKNMANTVGAAITDSLAQIAKKKVTENLAYAIEEAALGWASLGTGNVAGATSMFKSAALHVAAAAKWAMLGGAASAASAGMSGGGGGGSNGKNATAEKSAVPGPEIHLYIDGVDPTNPRHQQLIGDAQRQYRERYGADILVGK